MRTNGPLQLFPLLRIAVCMAVGVALAYDTRERVGEGIWLSALVLAVLLALLTRRRAVLQGLLICLSSLLLGATLMSRSCARLFHPLPSSEVSYEGVVASQPQRRGRVVRFDLWMVRGEMAGRRVKAALLCDSISRRFEQLGVGDGIVAASAMERPTNYYASNFDYPLFLRSHGFTATTLILPDHWRKAAVDLTPLSRLSRTMLASMRFRQSTLRRYLTLGLDDEATAVAVAMALGDRSRITRDLRDIYSISGASHVLALSGLHLGIIYMLLSLVVKQRKLGALREVLIIGGIWSYALFTGLSPSVVRAATMITVFSLTSLLQRRKMSLNALALTVIIMLVVNPMCVYDVGFQMSVMAVLAILVFYKTVYGLVAPAWLMSHPVAKWAWAMVVVSCSAQLGVAPLTAFYFGRFSVYFLLTNFLVIPLAYFVLYLTAAMFLVWFLPVVVGWVAKALAIVVGIQTMAVRWVASLPASSIDGIVLNRLQLFMVYVFIIAVAVMIYRLLRVKNRV